MNLMKLINKIIHHNIRTELVGTIISLTFQLIVFNFILFNFIL